MDDDDKTEFGTAELSAPVPRPGAAWAGITLVEEDAASPRPSLGADRPATHDVEAAQDAGRLASSSSARRTVRPLWWVLAAIVGAVVGIAAAQSAQRWFSSLDRGELHSSPALAPSSNANELPAGSEPQPNASLARGASAVVADSSSDVAVRTRGAEPAPRPSGWTPALSRNVVEALLAGRCSEARVALDASEDQKIGKIAAIARRVCRSGAQP